MQKIFQIGYFLQNKKPNVWLLDITFLLPEVVLM